MKQINQFTISCPLSTLHEDDPYLIGLGSLQPLIVSNRHSPQILTFENGEWHTLVSFEKKSDNHFYEVSVSPYGIVVSQYIELGENAKVEQKTLLDLKTAAPILSQNEKSLNVYNWLEDQISIGVDEQTNRWVCAALDGTIQWRTDIPNSGNMHLQIDKDYIYFWDYGIISVFDRLGHVAGKYLAPHDIMAPRFFSVNMFLEDNTLYIEGLNKEANKYMRWKSTETNAVPVPQILFDLSAISNIDRLEERDGNILLLSTQSGKKGVGTQCSLLCKKALTGPVPLFFVPEPGEEPWGGDIFWIDDTKFIYIQAGDNSKVDMYTIDGKKICKGDNLPGQLWGDVFYASGLLYIPTRKFSNKALEMKYYFTVFEL
ncbi:hypothetical protein [Bacteroides acidifaciens]|uniref:hypothetical protein n=1 Tax=Bacteroides acidifaciens TaxID=85831 RepID=UPI0026DEF125|nr:hypothetical protein [Bacteroides acidifaciens]